MPRPPRKSPAADKLIIGATAPPPRREQIGVGTRSGRVVLTFPEPVAWVALGKREALQLAVAMIQQAAKLPERP